MIKQDAFNEFWDSLAKKKETLPKSCDRMVRNKIEGLDSLDDYDLMTIKEVRNILNQCLIG